RDQALLHEDLAEPEPGRRLFGEGLLELILADQTLLDEQLADGPPRNGCRFHERLIDRERAVLELSTVRPGSGPARSDRGGRRRRREARPRTAHRPRGSPPRPYSRAGAPPRPTP